MAVVFQENVAVSVQYYKNRNMFSGYFDDTERTSLIYTPISRPPDSRIAASYTTRKGVCSLTCCTCMITSLSVSEGRDMEYRLQTPHKKKVRTTLGASNFIFKYIYNILIYIGL